MPLLGSDFDPTVPTDTAPVGQGAANIRDLKLRLKTFVAVSFNPDTGALLASAVPNPVTVPYGTAGTVYTSTGPATPPVWSAGSGIQTGSIMMWAGTLPAGYIEGVGGTVLIASYPALAAQYGTSFGGDGVTTIGLPDFRGRTPVGLGTGDAVHATAWTIGQKKGDESHTLTVPELAAHTHTYTRYSSKNGTNGVDQQWINDSTVNSGSTGNDQPHNNLQPSLGIRFIIKT